MKKQVADILNIYYIPIPGQLAVQQRIYIIQIKYFDCVSMQRGEMTVHFSRWLYTSQNDVYPKEMDTWACNMYVRHRAANRNTIAQNPVFGNWGTYASTWHFPCNKLYSGGAGNHAWYTSTRSPWWEPPFRKIFGQLSIILKEDSNSSNVC